MWYLVRPDVVDIRSSTFTWKVVMLIFLYSHKSGFNKHALFLVFCLHGYLYLVRLTAVTSSDWLYARNGMLGLEVNSKLKGV